MRICAIAGFAFAAVTAPVESQTAADRYYDPAEMAKSRAALKAHHGAQISSLILGERLEYQSNEGEELLVWEAQGWLGGDQNKLWLKTEGEYEGPNNEFESAEVQALYSRAVSPFWDVQAGIRVNITPNPSRTYATIGLQGLAPYWFELDHAFFLSDQGDLSMRTEAEYEFRLTQRLLLQPRIEMNLAFSDDLETGIGSGLSGLEAGLRLRYEFKRELAPYIGFNWEGSFGDTKALKRQNGEDSSAFSVIAGLRFWF